MQWTAWVTLAALAMYFWTVANVGKARGKYKVTAPSTDGPPAFQSILRVQLNSVEQLVFFLPALWLCAVFFSDRWAALGGAVWVVGRIMYAVSYYKEPAKRGPGFALSVLAGVALMLGAAAGLIMR